MKDFKTYLATIKEYGEVVQVNQPIVSVVGLPGLKPRELVLFESGVAGQVFSLGENEAEIVLFTKDAVTMGERVVRTDEFLSVPVGKELLGALLDPLGRPMDGTTLPDTIESRTTEGEVLGVFSRVLINKPLSSGVMVVDLLLPLGRGQKQLIIGDRKTGKTSFLLTIVKNQVRNGTIVIYAAIGRKQSDIKKVIEFFKKEGINKNIVTIASTSYDSPGLIYITPFSAMAVAEYFRDQGQDVVVIFDDLTTHAKFYREMSLIGRRFPGRESYPGDIFFVHARLLERSGNFIHEKKGEVSITSLPVIETVEGDLTGYIPTNVMSMTDGHIFFDQSTFAKGRRPAINVPLSVTRVGRQTQSALKRDINHKLTAFLTSFEQMQNLAHFGAELSGKVQSILKTGEKIYNLFNQPNHSIVDDEIQLILFSLIWSNTIESTDIAELSKKLEEGLKDKTTRTQVDTIMKAQNLDELILRVNQNKELLLRLLGGNEVTEDLITKKPPSQQEIAAKVAEVIEKDATQ